VDVKREALGEGFPEAPALQERCGATGECFEMSNHQQSPGSWRYGTVYPGERTTEAGRRTVF